MVEHERNTSLTVAIHTATRILGASEPRAVDWLHRHEDQLPELITATDSVISSFNTLTYADVDPAVFPHIRQVKYGLGWNTDIQGKNLPTITSLLASTDPMMCRTFAQALHGLSDRIRHGKFVAPKEYNPSSVFHDYQYHNDRRHGKAEVVGALLFAYEETILLLPQLDLGKDFYAGKVVGALVEEITNHPKNDLYIQTTRVDRLDWLKGNRFSQQLKKKHRNHKKH